ncbi:Ppx/GppA phosphatase family protein [Alkalitalea saponilacus]|uniref:Exopolyphosphatase / guanosine-5'-triphosphate,3'-diphosphate pyrophosphatase n=1 Tax=Alkalitalea saponilacus TaxID=889453 RepID=A0A1T5AS52_9BACT|nr:phosphatase [Alkalitalea saponilacus]ASB48618.1 phosphatase [Alkalitalea saponilacus]SKB37640.1 exopolyphosphatase / guanosine-5'-triphosphate,3'-diphosphate pyrophosphatase [Alkalitalea saponilacus]
MEKTRVAIIDLGTNTFNLLITEVDNNSYRILTESKYPVKLGEGGIHKATITSEAMKRGVEALTSHLIAISEYQVESIFCFATSAIRSATNGADFVRRVKQELGLTIRVIPGDEEAQTIFDGVKQVVPLANYYTLIMDIGGGSVEFIIANKNGIAWKESYNVGVARLLEQFTPSDPITSDQVKSIEKHLSSKLESLLNAVKQFPIFKVVGSSGSFDTLAAIIANQEFPLLDLSKITTFKIHEPFLKDIHQTLITNTADVRRVIPGMDRDRVDNIVPASIIVQWVLGKIKHQEVWQCSFALKEGAILQIINSEL